MYLALAIIMNNAIGRNRVWWWKKQGNSAWNSWNINRTRNRKIQFFLLHIREFQDTFSKLRKEKKTSTEDYAL